MVKAVNYMKKATEGKKRHARLKFWKAESKRLRKKYRATLFGASVLTVTVMLGYILLCLIPYRILRYTDAPVQLRYVYICATSVFGLILLSMLNVGGKYLALSLYRRKRDPLQQRITVGELFYAFGDNEKRKRIAVILLLRLKATVQTALSVFFFAVLYAFFGPHPGVIAVAVFLLIAAVCASQSRSLEWIFEIDREKTARRAYSHSMSAYAMTSREPESIYVSVGKLARLVIGSVLLVPGVALLYFPYAWTLEAVRAECISRELVTSRTERPQD